MAMLRKARRSAGFTLLEVLIALAILALSAAAVLRQTQQGLRQQQQLELKSAAMWLADDAMASLMLSANFPAVGRGTRTERFQDQDWRVAIDIAATPDDNLHKIVVSVALAEAPEDSALVSYTTYRGRY